MCLPPVPRTPYDDSILHIITVLFISSPFSSHMLHVVLPFLPPNIQPIWRTYVYLPKLLRRTERNMEAKRIFFEYKILDGLRRWRDDSTGTLEEVRRE